MGVPAPGQDPGPAQLHLRRGRRGEAPPPAHQAEVQAGPRPGPGPQPRHGDRGRPRRDLAEQDAGAEDHREGFRRQGDPALLLHAAEADRGGRHPARDADRHPGLLTRRGPQPGGHQDSPAADGHRSLGLLCTQPQTV